jgi:hypothetical protein
LTGIVGYNGTFINTGTVDVDDAVNASAAISVIGAAIDTVN